MAQLKDDCFAFGGELMPLSSALDLLQQRISPVAGVESVPIRQAADRTLAENIISPRNVPPHDNSAVDGFIVYYSDLDPVGDTRLPVTGRIAAGHPLTRKARHGEACRIFTGAQVPDGESGAPDTIFMEEDCTVDGDYVTLPPGLKKGSNLRDCGEDVKVGDVIIQAGQRLRPQEIGLAASVGCSELKVFSPLRAAVFSTGDEVRDPGTDAPAGCIYDANRYAVMSLLESLGCTVTDLGILKDDQAVIAASLDQAAPSHDLLITSGGVSLGEEDHVKAAVESLGKIDFWRLAIKPGRPIALGTVGETAFVGLPGNPVAAMVTFMMIARPVIKLLSGQRDVLPISYRVRSGFDYKKKTGRREWIRTRIDQDEQGPVAMKHHSSGAGILTSMVDADGLVVALEDSAGISAGDIVDFISFNEVAK